ncbi:hypothetical protein DPMN_061810 [Dreissena polymorpha]|uniref:Uncharacterized protein n=1 Tax=Dreissena polymorpha TaxID=45954 RepID=A0A9D4HHI1_DREPO|nr:hypothetical protein DPMN_061810 [Dreissena polymorpha]
MNNKVKDIIGRDDKRLKNLVNDLLDKLKESLLTSCTKQIKILEARLSEKEIENDTLNKDVKNLKSQVNIHSEENAKLKTELANQENNRRRSENDSNQYSRSNNIILSRIEHSSTEIDPNGMPLFESAEETTKISIAKITSITKESLPMEDVDIAHRLKRSPNGKKDIILRFKSRMTRNGVLRQSKLLCAEGVFVREDLTPLNHEVFMSVKRKMSDEVKSVWSRNGAISYKDARDVVQRVEWEDYQHWLDLQWPKK